MPLTPNKALSIAGYLLGFAFLLALFRPLVVSSYVEQLQDWQYMREFNLSLSSHPAVYVVPLPSDANFWSHVKPDCSDVRVTAGRGSSERLLDSVVLSCDPDSYSGKVAFFYSGSETTFRLYYGNPDASPPPTELNTSYLSGYIYHAPPFSEDDYVVRYCDDDWHGNLRFYHNKIVLAGWDEDCASAVLSTPVPNYAYVKLKLRGNGWGDATIDFLFSPTTSVDPDSEPETALRLRVNDDGKLHLQLLLGGEVVNEDVVNRNRDFWITFYPYGDHYRVYVGNSYLGDLPYSTYLTIVVEKGDSRVELKGVQIKYPVEEVSSVSYSPELLTPKSPRIEVSSPGDNTYYNSSVPISYTVTDPNGDLNSVSAYLNDTLLSTEPIFSTSLDLNEGSYTLRITASDREGLTSSETIHFYVDKTPPELNVDANYSDGNLHLDINVSDVSPVTCYLTVNSSTTEINCAPLDLNVSCNTSLRVTAQDAAGNSTYVDLSTPSCGAGTSGGTAGSGSSSSSGSSVSLSPPQSTPKPVVSITSYPTTSTPSTLSVVSTSNYFVGTLVLLLIIGYFVVRG